MFYFAESFDEVRDYLEGNFRLCSNSCIAQRHPNTEGMARDFTTGCVHYALVNSTDLADQGYIVIVDVEPFEDRGREFAAIDFIFPGITNDPDLSSMYSWLDEFAEFMEEEDCWAKVLLNYDRNGVKAWLNGISGNLGSCLEVTTEHLVFPHLSKLSHFADGNGQYEVVDLFQLINQK